MSITARANAINFTNILVATDLSRASLWSVPYVSAIARQYGSNIYIGHVLPLAIYTAARPQSFDAIEKECREHAQEKLDRYSAQIKEQRVGVQTLLAEGDVGIVIPDWVKQHHLDLVAVGTTGRSGVRKLWLVTRNRQQACQRNMSSSVERSGGTRISGALCGTRNDCR
jgi:nucleotide-binding universal stress UspA family protein